MKNTTTIDVQSDKVDYDKEIRSEIRQMWRDSFKPGEEWLEMYFDKVYRPEDAMILTAGDDDDVIASSLLLQRYMFYFHSSAVPMGYISGATTRRQYRGRGYMKELVNMALERAYERGDALVALIPASRHLYYYYDKLGFSTVFYVDEERYTALHRFAYIGKYSAVDPVGSHEVFSAVNAMLRGHDNVVLHTYTDFQNILADLTLDGGHAIALRDDNTGHIVAVAMVAPGDERVTVRELLYADEDAREAALEYARNLFEGKPMTVIVPPDDRNIPMHARGMARIVNAKKLLEAYASRYPQLRQSIRVYDPILPQNSHIYMIDRGEVVINDGFGGKIDLDVTEEVLLSILCSDAPIGEVFDLPTARPYISMMMD